MASFTSSEKRGLIALAVLLLAAAFVVLWVGGNLSGRDVGDVAGDDATAIYVEADSIVTTAAQGDSSQVMTGASSVGRNTAKSSARKNGKRKSARKQVSKPLPPPRQPLDQPVN